MKTLVLRVNDPEQAEHLQFVVETLSNSKDRAELTKAMFAFFLHSLLVDEAEPFVDLVAMGGQFMKKLRLTADELDALHDYINSQKLPQGSKETLLHQLGYFRDLCRGIRYQMN